MRTYSCVFAALLIGAGCASQKQVSKPASCPNIVAHVYETGRPEGARVDWNNPEKIEQFAGGAAKAGEGQVVTEGQGQLRDQADILLHEEELVVGKREVSNGGVLIRKVVTTENVSQPIELRREEYVIERVPMSREAVAGTPDTFAFQGQDIYIPLMREEAVTSTRSWLTERVHLGKKIETDHQTVTQKVRKEELQVVKKAGAPAGQTAAITPAEVGQGGTATQTGVLSASESSTSAKLELAKEEFMVGKRQIENGGVSLKKTVLTQEASQPVELKREEFTMEREPIANTIAQNPEYQTREIRIPLTREEAVVGTRTFVSEQVRVRKNVEMDKQTVSGTIRKENLEVIKDERYVK